MAKCLVCGRKSIGVKDPYFCSTKCLRIWKEKFGKFPENLRRGYN